MTTFKCFIVDSQGGISGSLTHLIDSSSYMIAGRNMSIVSQSNGAVVIGQISDPIGSTVSVVRTSTVQALTGTMLVDPTLQFIVNPGEVWSACFTLPITYNSGSATNELSVAGPVSSSMLWQSSFTNTGTTTAGNVNGQVVTETNVAAPRMGNLTVNVYIMADVTGSPAPVTLSYGQQGASGSVTAWAPAFLNATRIS